MPETLMHCGRVEACRGPAGARAAVVVRQCGAEVHLVVETEGTELALCVLDRLGVDHLRGVLAGVLAEERA